MKENDAKYYYFFRGSLDKHVEFYKGWVDVARKKGLPMEMVTTLYFLNYLKQRKLVKYYRKFDYVHIVVCLPFIASLFTFLYFFHKVVKYKRIVIHIRKRSPAPFEYLKKIFKTRVKYLIELESDIISEKEYLLEHPYKKDFYKDLINRTNKKISQIPVQLNKTDYVLTVTEKLRDLLDERYPHIGIKNKSGVIPTGVNIEAVHFSEDVRETMRRDLKIQDRFVFVYTGNAHYTWQNVYRTIEMFQLIKRTVKPNAFIMLLVREQDHWIVQEFIQQLKISEDDYLLWEVPHIDINKYLNAGDMGVLLRHPHLMNEAASPDKFGEYLAAGLPVIATTMAAYSDEIVQNNYGVILEDMDDDDEVLDKVVPFLKYDNKRRMKISEWAKEKFSTDAYAETYVKALWSLARE